MRVITCRRLLWMSLLFLLILGALGGRLYDLQIVKGELYARAAHHQRALSLPIAGRRGEILDRHGLPLTDPQPGWGVAAFPPLVRDAAATGRALEALMSLPDQAVTARLYRTSGPFWVSTHIADETAERLREMRLSGVVVAPVEMRYGPGSLARHLVGYVNAQGGQLGLESAFERELTGDAIPSIVALLDGTGNPLQGTGVRALVPQVGKPPYRLETTIDRRVQQAVEAVLDRHQHPDGGPLRGAVVVLEPNSGEVLAMASRPSFDQGADPGNQRGQGAAFLLNRAVSPFEPGSIFKPIVAAAALESGQVRLDERFTCPGHYDVGGQRFTDGHEGAHGSISFREAIALSCNVTFAKVGYERLGGQRLYAIAERFGFGRATGVGLREESPGLLPHLEYGGQVAQLAFGQGILTTPLQVARAYAAIANGGTLPPIQLVRAVKEPSGRVVERPAVERPARVMSRETAWQLQKALAGVTDPQGQGTGRQAWVAEGGSAGKTGSAEGTEDGHPTVHAWFAGYLPATAPRYVIVVLVQGGGAGGAVAAPIFREIGQALPR